MENKNWNPQEVLADIKRRYQYAAYRNIFGDNDRFKREYLAHKLLLDHPKINEKTYNKHIDSVMKDLSSLGKIENGKLRLNPKDVKSAFLKNHLQELAKAKRAKELYHKVEAIHRNALYSDQDSLSLLDDTDGFKAKYSSKDHAKLLGDIKQYYKSKGFPMNQRTSEIIKQAKSDPNHPLSTTGNGHEIFNDLINTLKEGESKNKSGKTGISFRNKYKKG